MLGLVPQVLRATFLLDHPPDGLRAKVPKVDGDTAVLTRSGGGAAMSK